MGQIVYVQVLLPLKLEWTPWYSTEEELRVGQRVEVIFARKSQIGVVVRIRDHPEIDPAKVERIQSADTGLPDISENELRLWAFTVHPLQFTFELSAAFVAGVVVAHLLL